MPIIANCTEQKRLLPGAIGDLEVLIECPKPEQARSALAIICHPHPLYGGSLDNKVVYMLAAALRQLGAITLRFNFRGVGKSRGEFAEGVGETEDLLRLSEWATSYFAPQQVWLAGFSFGSFVALRAHKRLAPQRLILVAPPVQRFKFEQTQLSKLPCLVLQGDADEVVEPGAVNTWVAQQTHQPTYQILTQADHFFHGRLTELRDHVIAWMQDKRSA